MLQHLYREVSDPDELKELLEDPELRKEFGELEEVHHYLESGMGRTRPHAPEDSVERVMNAATARPRPDGIKVFRRRPRRIWILGGSLSAAAAVLAILIWADRPEPLPSEPAEFIGQRDEAASDTVLTWDDTDDFIEIRQSLSVVRQRTSPQLWDESAVMTLDSIPSDPTRAIPNLEYVSTPPRIP